MRSDLMRAAATVLAAAALGAGAVYAAPELRARGVLPPLAEHTDSAGAVGLSAASRAAIDALLARTAIGEPAPPAFAEACLDPARPVHAALASVAGVPFLELYVAVPAASPTSGAGPGADSGAGPSAGLGGLDLVRYRAPLDSLDIRAASDGRLELTSLDGFAVRRWRVAETGELLEAGARASAPAWSLACPDAPRAAAALIGWTNGAALPGMN